MKSKKGIDKVFKMKTPDDKVIISSEYYEDDRPSYICSICNQTLIRLTDSSMQNTAFWCRNCSVEYDVESENVRRESKISVPDRNEEPLVAQTPGQGYLNKKVEIHKELVLSGGFAELAKRGLKIKDYKENIPRPRTKR